jgi:ribosomal subunit interface protein
MESRLQATKPAACRPARGLALPGRQRRGAETRRRRGSLRGLPSRDRFGVPASAGETSDPPIDVLNGTRQCRTLQPDMKFILSTHNVTLTEAIEQYVLGKLEKLESIDRWLLDARVTLEKETRSSVDVFKCGIRLGIRGNDLYAEDKEPDLYAAVDLTVKKLEQQIRKKHSKAKARTQRTAARSKEKKKESV